MDSGCVKNVWVQVTCDIHRHNDIDLSMLDAVARESPDVEFFEGDLFQVEKCFPGDLLKVNKLNGKLMLTAN